MAKEKKNVLKTLNLILTIVLCAIMAVTAIFLIFALTLKAKGSSKSPLVFGIGFFQIISGSMEPEVLIDDVIIGKKTEVKDLNLGDNLIFFYNGKIVTHKLISINSDGTVTTHGINNPEGANEIVKNSDIIAKQIINIKGLGKFLNFLRSGLGFVLVIILPLLILIAVQSVSVVRKFKEARQASGAEGEAIGEEKIQEEIDGLKKRLEEQYSDVAEQNGMGGDISDEEGEIGHKEEDEGDKSKESEP